MEQQGKMRADGRRNRVAILRAAAEVFAREGFAVPLERIASAAGVGRATLYRNFANREELVLAIFDQNVQRLEARSEALGDAPDGFRRILDLLVVDAAAHAALSEAVTARDSEAVESLLWRITAVLLRHLGPARAAGEIRADLGPEDLPLLVGMLSSGLPRGDLDLRERQGRRMLELLLHGIAGD